MRRIVGVVALVLFAGSAVRAEEPQGFIGVQVKLEEGKLVVVEAFKDGPADKAGVKPDDVLLQIGDTKLKDKMEEEDLQAAVKEIGKNAPGKKLKLTVKRGDKEMAIEITVAKRSDVIKE